MISSPPHSENQIASVPVEPGEEPVPQPAAEEERKQEDQDQMTKEIKENTLIVELLERKRSNEQNYLQRNDLNDLLEEFNS